MNQIIKLWCEKNGFGMIIRKKEIWLIDLRKFPVLEIFIDKKTYSINWRVHPLYPIIFAYDYIKDLKATLQCGLPMLWGI